VDPDLAKLAKDKRVWLAGAGALALGLFTYARRAKTGGSGGDAPSSTGAPGHSGIQGGADTTGTDISSFLGSWGAQQNAAFQQFLSQLPTTTPGAAATDLSRVAGFRDNSPLNWDHSVQVGWNVVPGAKGYVVRNFLSPDQQFRVDDPNATAFQIPGLLANGSYFWQIAPLDQAGAVGPWSDYLTTHTKA
jgi:hypothetical protein